MLLDELLKPAEYAGFNGSADCSAGSSERKTDRVSFSLFSAASHQHPTLKFRIPESDRLRHNPRNDRFSAGPLEKRLPGEGLRELGSQKPGARPEPLTAVQKRLPGLGLASKPASFSDVAMASVSHPLDTRSRATLSTSETSTSKTPR